MEKKLDIMIVDDNPEVADILGKLIETDGHKVTVTYDGEKALESYQDKKFDLVFVDISMPGMNGIDFTQKLFELDKNARVVGITGHIGTKEVEEILNAGALAFLKKPFSKKDIDQKIEEILKIG
jgi:CheY-like chemotaxis protein